MRLIDIAIVVFGTLTVVCVILAAIRFAWLKRKERTSSNDEELAREPRMGSGDDVLP